jgi:hypothetical protein
MSKMLLMNALYLIPAILAGIALGMAIAAIWILR